MLSENKILKEISELYEKGLLKEAFERCQDALKDYPKSSQCYDYAGILSFQLQSFDEAKKYFEMAIQHDPKEARYHHHLGNVWVRLKENELAIASYERALALNEQYAEVYNSLGNLYYQSAHYDRAKGYYEKAIKYSEKYIDAWINLGNALIQLKDYETAKKTLEHASQLSPKDYQTVSIYYPLGLLAHEAQQHQEVVILMKKLLDIDSHHAKGRHLLALNQLLLNEIKEAIYQYSVYLDQVPTDFEAHYNAGTLLMRQHDMNAATYHFQQVIKFKPDHLDALLNLGALSLGRGMREAALESYEAVLKYDPHNETAQYLIAAMTQQSQESAPVGYLKQLFDMYAPYYESHLLTQLHYHTPTLFEKQFAALGLPMSLRILDLGCGTGLVGETLKPWAAYLIGVDLSPKMLAVAAQKNVYDELILADLKNVLHDHSGDIDCLTAGDVFIYLGDLQSIFEAGYRALRKGGYFLFSVEATDLHPSFYLQQNARFAHSKSYLQELSKNNHFKVISLEKACLRKQNEEDVIGYVVLLQKGESHAKPSS